MRTVFTACGDALIMHRLPENYPGQMQIQEYLKTGDFRIVNLETTITDKNCYPSTFSGGTWLTAEAPVLDDLLDFGFNLWGIANNHMLDYSYPGLFQTLSALRQRGIAFTGAGESLEKASKAAIAESAAGRTALIALTSTFDDSARAGIQGPYLPARPGINPMRFEQKYLLNQAHMDQLKEIADVCNVNVKNKRRLKTGYKLQESNDIFEFKDMKFCLNAQEGKITIPSTVDLNRTIRAIEELKRDVEHVVVMFHSHEMKDDNMESIEDFVQECPHAFIDAGASLVLGGGCHQLKGIELYKGKPVFYSLGNFIYQNEFVDVLPPDFMDKYKLPYTTTAREAIAYRKSKAKNGGQQSKENFLSVLPRVVMEGGQCISIEMLPISLGYEQVRSFKAIPGPADETDSNLIYQTLARLSEPFGTEMYMENGLIKIRTEEK